ncbi:putative sulfate exporter family transporter [Selenomonas sp. TAMA-11512]|uniref:YeiH family protein n=1 Tax=Selenomonas sp. TAMA-11512 TaxID=3095337 RepID=UPI0030873C9E|nr:putative sulfate exporter family transporter [Selenomonas sp. TAMA-11512]
MQQETTGGNILRRFHAFFPAFIITFICSILGRELALLPGLSLVGHLVLALLLGMAVQLMRSVTIAARGSGTGFIANRFLRAGIILLGFKLNLAILLTEGLKGLEAAVCMVTSMLLLNYVTARLLKVDHTLAMLTACGCSICGAAAVMAVSAPLKAKADQSVLAVAIVAILGTVFTLIEVGLIPFLGFTDAQFGTMAGLSLHEIAHAVAAGGSAGQVGTDAAIIAKLSRVLLLAPVALIVGFIEMRRNRSDASEDGKLSVPIPYFMGGFILASAVGSYLNFPSDVLGALVSLAYILLGMAMAALGINVNFGVIVKQGARPLLAAAACSAVMLLLAWFVVDAFFA